MDNGNIKDSQIVLKWNLQKNNSALHQPIHALKYRGKWIVHMFFFFFNKRVNIPEVQNVQDHNFVKQRNDISETIIEQLIEKLSERLPFVKTPTITSWNNNGSDISLVYYSSVTYHVKKKYREKHGFMKWSNSQISR